MVEPIFQTIARAKEVSFTRPYAYFGYCGAIVRKGESRFKAFSDLNQPGLSVVVVQGYTDDSYAREHLPDAKVRSMKVDDVNLIFLEVLSGNADAALSDVAQVKAFQREHPDKVDMLFVDAPPAFVPAGIMLKQGDFALANFLNASLDYMEANGVLDQLDAKYGVTAFREKRQLR